MMYYYQKYENKELQLRKIKQDLRKQRMRADKIRTIDIST